MSGGSGPPQKSEPEYLYPPGPSQETGGVVPLPIQGRFHDVRQRHAGGFTDEDRAWRRQWLRDQILHPDEPVTPPNWDKERYNIIRRLGRIPLNIIFKPIKPLLGEYYVSTRHLTGRFLMGIAAAYWFWYYAKYRGHTWESRSGWRAKINSGTCYPGEPDYPRVIQREFKDYGYQIKVDFDLKPSTPI